MTGHPVADMEIEILTGSEHALAEEAARLRVLLHAALALLHDRLQEIERQRETIAALREEQRRFTAAVVSGRRAA